jgi:predicted ABC-type ATPase
MLVSPRLTVFAGPNGSGKTTLMRDLHSKGFQFGEYINPDDIAAELSGSYDERVKAAQRIADERREACIGFRRAFTFETVMSHESKIDVMRRAREAGFHVTLFFVGTDDPGVNVSRVAARIERGGHSVPEDRIVARYSRTMESLWAAACTANEAYIFDNTSLENSFDRCVEFQLFTENEGGSFDTPSTFPLLHVQNLSSIWDSASDFRFPRWIAKYFLDKVHSEIQSQIATGRRPSFRVRIGVF